MHLSPVEFIVLEVTRGHPHILRPLPLQNAHSIVSQVATHVTQVRDATAYHTVPTTEENVPANTN